MKIIKTLTKFSQYLFLSSFYESNFHHTFYNFSQKKKNIFIILNTRFFNIRLQYIPQLAMLGNIKVIALDSEHYGKAPVELTIKSELGSINNTLFPNQPELDLPSQPLQVTDHIEVFVAETPNDQKVGYSKVCLVNYLQKKHDQHNIEIKCLWKNKENHHITEETSVTLKIQMAFTELQKTGESAYQVAYRRSTSPDTREDFWREQAKNISWFEFPKTILDSTNLPFSRWYPDGVTNINYNMIDRHLPKQADQTSLIWVSNMVQKEITYTLQQVYENVCKMSNFLKGLGVQKGDRVIIYMPMIPEALFATWACGRIGAVHSIVFGGFAAKQLASRIKDSDPKVIVTASCGLEPNKKINYVDILTEAINYSEKTPSVAIYQRPDLRIQCNKQWIQFKIEDLQFKHVDCQPMKSTDPLYILYTSGSTGQPKGVVRDQGGTCVALQWVMNHIMDIHPKDVYFASSDIGWVVGHNYIIYGPLIRGAATVLYEGKPMLPNPGVIWAIVEKYKVKGLYTSPTGLRAIRKQDNNGQWVEKYDISSLQLVSMAGQRCDIPTYEWISNKLKVLINDNYWQTEVGWGISCNYKNLTTFTPKPGSATMPCPGFKVQILSPENEVLPKKALGKVCVKLPMPPSFMLTLYNNDKAFLQKYMEETPGYYTTGDAGYIDEDGYLNVMTRLDDIINTAGHRLSTAAMEEVLMSHPRISQAAVVAKIEQLKGQIPIGFVVFKSGHQVQGIEKQLIGLIRKQIGPVAAFQNVLVLEKLPKTRSGKILRHILRKMVEGQHYKYPPTIEDDSVLKVVEEKIKSYGRGLGQKKKLVYRGDVDFENDLKQFEDAQQRLNYIPSEPEIRAE